MAYLHFNIIFHTDHGHRFLLRFFWDYHSAHSRLFNCGDIVDNLMLV